MLVRAGVRCTIGIVLLIAIASGAVAAAEGEGIGVPIADEFNDGHLDQMEETLAAAGYDVPDNRMIVIDGSTTYYVFTDAETEHGLVTFTGQDVTYAYAAETGWDDADAVADVDERVVFADDLTVDTDGKRVPYESFREDPDRYAGELVEFTTDYRQFALVFDPLDGGYMQYRSLGATGSSTGAFASNPTELAAWATVNTSLYQHTAEHGSAMGSLDGELETVHLSPVFWMDGETHVTVGVVENEQSTQLVLIDATPAGDQVTASEISSGAVSSGDRVVVEDATAAGATISTREALVSVAGCAPDAILFPFVNCLPLVTDTVVHAGVVADASGEATVPIIGVSNHHQDTLAEPFSGSYDLGGEVVTAEELDVEIDAPYALRVEYMDRTGAAASADDLEHEADAFKQDVLSRLESYGGEDALVPQRGDDGSNAGEPATVDLDETQIWNLQDVPRQVDVEYEWIQRWAPAGNDVVLEVSVHNTGETDVAFPLEVRTAGVVTADVDVELEPGEQQVVESRYEAKPDAQYQLFVNDEPIGMGGDEAAKPATPTPTPDAETPDESDGSSAPGGPAVAPALLVVLLTVLARAQQL